MKKCTLCNALLFDSDMIDHFRCGDVKHRTAYNLVLRELDIMEDVAFMPIEIRNKFRENLFKREYEKIIEG